MKYLTILFGLVSSLFPHIGKSKQFAFYKCHFNLGCAARDERKTRISPMFNHAVLTEKTIGEFLRHSRKMPWLDHNCIRKTVFPLIRYATKLRCMVYILSASLNDAQKGKERNLYTLWVVNYIRRWTDKSPRKLGNSIRHVFFISPSVQKECHMMLCFCKLRMDIGTI
jgi:hypothetical protein